MAMAAPLIGAGLASAGTAAAGALASGGIGTAISAAATGLGALSAFKAQRGQAEAMKAEAGARTRAAALDAAQRRRANRLAAARERTMAGDAGALSGSTFNLLQANAVQREMDVLTAQNNAEAQANTMRAEASQAQQQANWGLAGGVLNVAGQYVDPLNFGLV